MGDHRLVDRFACRFCRHDQYRHNLTEGCPHCPCMATPGEAGAVTDAEMDYAILSPAEMLPQYRGRSWAGVAKRLDPDDGRRYTEAAAQMADPDRYAALRALTFEQRHPCPVGDCGLSAEEHHRLAYGYLAENRELRRRVQALEHGPTTTEEN